MRGNLSREDYAEIMSEFELGLKDVDFKVFLYAGPAWTQASSNPYVMQQGHAFEPRWDIEEKPLVAAYRKGEVREYAKRLLVQSMLDGSLPKGWKPE